MVIQVDIPFAAAMGSLAAGAARIPLQSGGRVEYLRTWLATNLFLMFGFSWIPVYFLLNYFGWETTHMWWTAPDASAYPWFIPAALLLMFAFGNGGFLLGARLVMQGRVGANRLLYTGILAACTAWMVGFYPRTLKLGSYGTWEAAPWVYEDPVFMGAWAVTMTIWIGSYLALLAHLGRRGRELHVGAAGLGGARRVGTAR